MKLLKYIGIVFLVFLMPSIAYSGESFNVISYPVEDITKNSGTLKGEVVNPQNRVLDIYINIKPKNESEFREFIFVKGVSQENFPINYYIVDLESGSEYEYFIRAQQQEGNEKSISSNIIKFNTLDEVGILNIDLQDQFNQYFIMLLLLIGVILFFTSFKIVTAGILIVIGSMLLFSGFSFIISFLILIFGLGLIFMT